MRNILYLGTDPTHFAGKGKVTHYPIIQIIPRDFSSPEIVSAFADLSRYTHFIFTSKHSVEFFLQLMPSDFPLEYKTLIAIGPSTAKKLPPSLLPKEETQEGIVALLDSLDLTNAFLFCPRSALARTVLDTYCRTNQISLRTCALYDTEVQKQESLPNLDHFDEIVFTSPSTVEAFLQIFKTLPHGKTLTPIGPITASALQICIDRLSSAPKQGEIP